MKPADPLRIANCSGFYGDRLSAAKEMITGGAIDFLTGDYLAELTMLILWKQRQRDPGLGYATTFYSQMEDVLSTVAERGIKIVTNAGGLNPAGLAQRLKELAANLGVNLKIAYIEGDDITDRIGQLQEQGHALANIDTGQPLSATSSDVVTANAYLGAWGIVEALASGADIVLCGRVTDASLVVGPAAWHFGWQPDNFDELAGAVVAGHVLECGAQATGGNYAFFREVKGLEHPGFPLAEISADGSSVITKHPGTGGLVSVGTVTAQLLYEIASPNYANPDVIARFDTINLEDDGTDRVRISGVKGLPAPATTKVCINLLGGYRNTMSFMLTGLDIEAKADLAQRSLLDSLRGSAVEAADLEFQLIRSDHPDAPSNAEASAELRITAKSPNPANVSRSFSSKAVEIALSSYPGLYMTSPPGKEVAYGVYWPALVPSELIRQTVVRADGSKALIETSPPGPAGPSTSTVPAAVASGKPEFAAARPQQDSNSRRVPLGTLLGARSGDKGGNANVGVWARCEASYEWMQDFLTVEKLRELIAEAQELPVQRYELPNLLALNFVIVGLLGEGVASSTRPDAQAKSLGEYLRSKVVEVPEVLLQALTETLTELV
ncbi:MAG: DUF1446 domain-containing protein [Actinomycetota bacterium]|jgi:hypothetical protein|nr:DUF1446 domain-containing protein [Actinomycetota bacterium]